MPRHIIPARTLRPGPEILGRLSRIGAIIPCREIQFPHGVGSRTRYRVETGGICTDWRIVISRPVRSLGGNGKRWITGAHFISRGDTARPEIYRRPRRRRSASCHLGYLPKAARMLPAKASPIARMTVALVSRLTIVVTSATVTIAPRTLNRPSPIALPSHSSAQSTAERAADSVNNACRLRTRQHSRN